jgi:hypothetical protein
MTHPELLWLQQLPDRVHRIHKVIFNTLTRRINISLDEHKSRLELIFQLKIGLCACYRVCPEQIIA